MTSVNRRPTIFSKTALEVDRNSSHEFSVVSYNILADCHVTGCREYAYAFVSDEYLYKKDGCQSARHNLLTNELADLNGDILLLQEVEVGYAPGLFSHLQRIGYECHYLKRSCEIPEGLAICYRSSVFQCLELHHISMSDEVAEMCFREGLSEEDAYPLRKGAVSLIAVLKHAPSGALLICANIHVTYECFRQPFVQALQACIPCQKIADLRRQLALRHTVDEGSIHIVYGGDFNGEPDHMSVQLLKRGQLHAEEMDKLVALTYEVKDQRALEKKLDSANPVFHRLRGYLHHSLHLKSAYEVSMGREPAITTAEGTYVGTLDYIFASRQLDVISVLGVDDSTADEYKLGGPTPRFASDHLPLKSTFALSIQVKH